MSERTPADRRSSVRVRSLLPCQIDPVEQDRIEALEARILDLAVLESDSVMNDALDWRDHAEDLSREMIFVLNELRAMRQQITEMQRLIETHNQAGLASRWVELNDQGLWLAGDEDQPRWEVGDLAEIRVQIPSLHSPEILALGEVVRVDEAPERAGAAFAFRAISQPHQQAIARYALRRERQLARSKRQRFMI
ncbi:hypothetical protein DL240_06410 [Lujinxingia litoralis]|uniref:PilZ domain-containing protein n=1 Tax=Lujinxingia litoralis TaxID=2211119 RepID=A0A328C9F7_9DELT|nr:hypothetical protein [Lujinxingia litoralis]RAL23782.1 hypothetical protein DL240_06410 [Lujinxingia litoralis]